MVRLTSSKGHNAAKQNSLYATIMGLGPVMGTVIFLCGFVATYGWYASNKVLEGIELHQRENMALIQDLQRQLREKSKPQGSVSQGGKQAMVLPQLSSRGLNQGHPLGVDESKLPKLRYDSSDATVMAMAQGYALHVHRRFIGSLRRVGFKGTILYAVEYEMKNGVEDFLLSHNVTLLRLNYTECDKPVYDERMEKIHGKRGKEGNTCIYPYPNVKIRWGRYPFLRDALKNCEKCTGPALVTDARDTFFQRDPFADGLPEIQGLQLYAEHFSIQADNFFVRNRVRACHNGFQMKGPMLCSGTTIANREDMLEYMEIMYQEMIYWTNHEKCQKIKSHGGDQAIENYLYYTGKFNHLDPVVNYPRMGIVNTAGVVGAGIAGWEYKRDKLFGKENKDMTSMLLPPNSTSWLSPLFDLVDAQGYFLDLDGSRSRVIHQFDRFGNSLHEWMAETNTFYDSGENNPALKGKKKMKKK